MEKLVIDASSSTPYIEMNPETGVVLMRGESYPENSFDLYNPVITWVAEFLSAQSTPLRFEIEMTYMNTSTIKCFMELLDALELNHKQGKAISMNWYYDPENDRAVDLAEELMEDYSFPCEIKRIGG